MKGEEVIILKIQDIADMIAYNQLKGYTVSDVINKSICIADCIVIKTNEGINSLVIKCTDMDRVLLDNANSGLYSRTLFSKCKGSIIVDFTNNKWYDYINYIITDTNMEIVVMCERKPIGNWYGDGIVIFDTEHRYIGSTLYDSFYARNMKKESKVNIKLEYKSYII